MSTAAPSARQRILSRRSLRTLIMALFLCHGLGPSALSVLAQTSPAAGTSITNKAFGSFKPAGAAPGDPPTTLESNEVIVTVSEVAGITITNAGIIDDGEVNPGDVIDYQFTITNTGNADTVFFLPDSPSAVTNGSFDQVAAPIQIISYDPDGAGPTASIDLTASNITIPAGGGNTNDPDLLGGLALANNGIIPANATLTLQVPITVDATGLNDGDAVTVVMGDSGAQNQPDQDDGPNTTEFRTIDPTPGNNTDDPVNGEREAGNSQATTITVSSAIGTGKITVDDVAGTPQPIPFSDSDGLCTTALTRTFTVTDNIIVRDVNLGLNLDHGRRGEVAAYLTSPDGLRLKVVNQGSDSNDNYDVMLVNNTTNDLNDGNNDDTAAPLYDRQAASYNSNLTSFYNIQSQGTWTLELCDTFNFSLDGSGTYNSAQLMLSSTEFFSDASFPAIVPNPDYNLGCSSSINIAVVVDASGSIMNDEITNTRTALQAMLNEFAAASSPPNVGIVEFAEIAEVQLGGGFTAVTPSNITTIFDPYINGVLLNQRTNPPGGLGVLTNWQDALETTTNTLLPDADVVIFITDGNPNTVNQGGGTLQHGEDDPRPLSAAILAANAIKTSGRHIYAFGVTDDVSAGRLVTLVDGINSTEFPDDSANTADFARVGTFETNDFAAELVALAQGLCATAPSAALDYGDAPDTYGTDATDAGGEGIGARHIITSGIQIGATIDAETDAVAPLDGTGDDTDEDGITLTTLTEDDTTYTIPAANITVTNTTGGPATLHAWVDFDGSGVFEADEYTSQTVSDAVTNGNPDGDLVWSGAGVSDITGDTNTFARFRLTTGALTDDTNTAAVDERAIGNAPDGEVEDYGFTIALAPKTISGTVFEDFGATNDANNMPDSGETRLGDIRLSLYFDDGTTPGMLDADDTLFAETESNSTDGTYSFQVSVTGNYFVVLDHLDTDAPSSTSSLPDRTVWEVLFSGEDSTNRDFPYDPIDPSYDECPADIFLLQGSSVTDIFGLEIVSGQTEILLDNLQNGAAENISANAVGFNTTDNFIYGYYTLDGVTNAGVGDGSLVRIGSGQATVLGPIVGLPRGNVVVGDVNNDGHHYLYFNDTLYVVDVNVRSSTYLQLITTLSLPGVDIADFAFNPVDDNLYTIDNASRHLLRIDPNTATVTDLGDTNIPGTAAANPLVAMYFDVAGHLYASVVATGEIYRVDVTAAASFNPPTAIKFADGPVLATDATGTRCPNAPLEVDYGDAPDATVGNGPGDYSTLIITDGPRHRIDSNLSLGSGVTADTDGFVDGTDDNGNATDDSDDGVTIAPDIPVSGDYTLPDIAVQNATATDATLYAWIDFDQDGQFAADEFASTTVTPGTSTTSLTWTVTADAIPGSTFVRFRLTTDALTDDLGTADFDERALGPASDGEVEDYQFVGNPNVLLVKRITAINGLTTNPNDGTTRLDQVVDDVASAYADDDNAIGWPANYLVGAMNAGPVNPGDTIEYTVYFLSSGNTAAEDVRFCDLIQPGQMFQLGTYGGADAQLQLGTSAVIPLTAALDEIAGVDRAQFIPGGNPVPSNCFLKNGNDNGTLVIDLTGSVGAPSLSTFPNSTGPGTPNNSYGLFRFTTQVDE